MPSSRPAHPDLSPLVQACEEDLRACAEVWHQRGAQRFGLYAEEKPLFESGTEKVKRTAVMRQSPVMLDGEARAFVRVHGPAAKLMQSHLDANAALFGRIFQLEHETRVKSMYLDNIQKRLAHLYDFVRASRLMHNTIGDVIAEMTRTSLDVLNASGTFLYLHMPRPISACNQIANFSDAQGYAYFQHAQLMSSPQRAPLMPSRKPGEEVLLLPIRVTGEVQGVMGFIDPPARFTPFYEKLAEIVAEQTGARLEHVLLYDNMLHQQRLTTEMELARQVQMHLLPQKQPSIPGLDICGMTFPALQVGGDFYEFIVNDKSFTFIVGDVSGKGLSAAMMMAMTRAILRSTASFNFAMMTPEDVLTQTNEDVYEDYNRVVTFTTTFMGQYELAPARDRLTIANAGHSPVVYCPKGEPARLLEADAPPLGVLDKIEVSNHIIGFKPGDVLIVATDGFSEAENSADEIFGYDRLLELAVQTRHLSARDIVKAFSEVATAFEGDRPQHDDRTIVVIKRINPPDEDSSHATTS
jgi:phosphoserine phosphatase RsbU/P